jgi:hypothetical protein
VCLLAPVVVPAVYLAASAAIAGLVRQPAARVVPWEPRPVADLANGMIGPWWFLDGPAVVLAARAAGLAAAVMGLAGAASIVAAAGGREPRGTMSWLVLAKSSRLSVGWLVMGWFLSQEAALPVPARIDPLVASPLARSGQANAGFTQARPWSPLVSGSGGQLAHIAGAWPSGLALAR